jgi:hypothetical protein
MYLAEVLRVPHNLDADPNPTVHFDADPDPTFYYDANSAPTFHFEADPDLAPYQLVENL